MVVKHCIATERYIPTGCAHGGVGAKAPSYQSICQENQST